MLLPGEFHGQRSLVGGRPWGCKESDMTEHLNTHVHTHARTHTHTHTCTRAHTHTSYVPSSAASPTALHFFIPHNSSLLLKLTKHTPAPGFLHLLFPLPAAPTTDVFAAFSLDSCRSLFQMLPHQSCLSRLITFCDNSSSPSPSFSITLILSHFLIVHMFVFCLSTPPPIRM